MKALLNSNPCTHHDLVGTLTPPMPGEGYGFGRVARILLVVAVWLLTGYLSPVRAQESSSHLASYWINELARQSDSTRKAEVLLFIAKDVETTAPSQALKYAEHALALGEKLKAPKVGVLRALQEFGIPVDVVGGTSVGGLVAAAFSFDESVDTVTLHLRKAALYNPTKDYNLLPFISLIRGRRIKQMLQTCIQDFTSLPDTGIEDRWITFFTLSSNYTQAREELHTRGSLLKYLRATSAIPGVFTPIIEGDDLLVDGGTFNNFPADIMSRSKVGKVVGVDLNIDKPRKLNMEEIPSPLSLLRDRFRPRPLKKYRLPSLVSIMLNSTLLYSSARRNENIRFTDLYFNPDVSRFGMMSWAAYDQIVAKGYEHAREVLSQLSPEELATFQA